MIVVCETCQKKYRIYPEKMETEEASFSCEVCRNLIRVQRSQPNLAPATNNGPDQPSSLVEPDLNPPSSNVPAVISAISARVTGKGRIELGLRSKMLVLFLLIPSLIMILAALLYLRQLEDFSDLITEESSEAIQAMADEKIIDASRSIAAQCRLFLESHPFLEKEMFNNHMEFRRLAVQKIGQTGYTSLYQLPGEDNVWRAWAHFDATMVGQDVTSVQKAMGDHLPVFMKIFANAKTGAESKGYFDQVDKETKRKKFLVLTPVGGTRFVIAGTTFMDEFSQPVRRIQTRAQKITDRAGNGTVIIGSLILIGAVVIYSYRLTERIRILTQVADEISVGDLQATVRIDARDEIGYLGEAIARMQDSIRMSIERLRKRR
jgi:HAMP domain-containing protein